ncbi:MAG: hypothetical protein HRT44_14150, partial [Bdellovibrionales bacterium]|nr:hypothetical protein [Bdellovibrionales bacterium]NQZ20380.1 hypothetical protein [Bdellovibrionales bacterium]
MEWAVLRFYFFFSFGRFKRKSPRLPATLIFKKVIKSLGNNIKVFFKYFLKADVWVLSNNAETRWHDGQKINKVLHSVLAESDSLVFFERYLRPKNETTDYSNRFDFFFFETQIRVISFFINLFYSSEKISKLQAEFTKDGLEEVNFAHKRWCQFLASKILWRVLLTIKKPKLVLITDYHNAINMALVYQLKKMNIKSVEYQHGIISPKHPAYMYDPKVAEKGRPDYLVYFSLPNKWENTIAYDAKKVVFSSSYILQECQKKRDGYIDNHSGDQRKSKPRVLVSLQNSSIQETTDFVCQAISRFKEGEFEFILLPRDKQPQIPFNRSDVHVEND